MSNKGALALLAEYEGDSSEDEVPGTRASTKRLHKDDDEEPRNKRFERLPVPNFTINKLEEVVDDPGLHEGRLRSFPHERGNWATYVYIPYEANEGLQRLISRIADLSQVENIELKFFDSFHLSLTRTVVLRHHLIEPFVNTIRENISHFNKFIVMFDSLEVYTNEEKTRTFLGLQIKTGYDSLVKLIQCLDHCLGEFKLQKFYENPSFHISIAWCLGDATEKFKSIIGDLNHELEQLMNEFSQENWYIYVEEVFCRTGNKLFRFQLL
ncbi:U6 snRNA phosphodiesterase [Tribolium madens]|uniref:U6 snRNA phosphodiesterase n=1 Tax=Tribolium madens TaxID=41895 RepID=UPI001CF72AEE|nr:U6 snRNA phosphodiesterase [Tribolium madens]